MRLEIDIAKFLICVLVTVASYIFATQLTGLRVKKMLDDTTEMLFARTMVYASKRERRKLQEFDLLSEEKKRKSLSYRYFSLINELLLDIGWRKSGMTPEAFTAFNTLFSVFMGVILMVVVQNLFVVVYLSVIIFVMNIALMFSFSRYGARRRVRRLIAAENLICGNISRGFEEAVRLNMALFDAEIRPAFANFLDRWTLQNYSLQRALALLNQELGDHSTALLRRVLIYEEERRPGQEDMFRFIMACNIREEERNAVRDLHFAEMNKNFIVCAAILIGFVAMCIGTFPEVLLLYLTPVGKMILAIFVSLIMLTFVFVQAMQSKRFTFRPSKLR